MARKTRAAKIAAKSKTPKRKGVAVPLQARPADKTPTIKTSKIDALTIKPPKFDMADIRIRGISPLVINAFAAENVNRMREQQEKGSTTQKNRKREPKDFDRVYRGAMHVSRQGWHGIAASAFRNALISACRVVGFKMTLAKLSLFVEADGFDAASGDPLVKITKGKPEKHFAAARNDNGSTDIRCRPMWREGWEAIVRVRWDSEQFTASDVVNLMARVGLQVGIGAGRPDSRQSAGVGWGLFEVLN